MLARMIVGGQPVSDAGLPPLADHIVTSDAEWDAVFANSAATLAGKTIEIVGSNFTQRTINGKDVWPEGGRLTIRSRDANASIPSILFNGVTRGIDFSGFNFQMTGWPRSHSACVIFNSGTFGKIRFLNGTTFRHGYGPDQLDCDTTAELPEYERIDNVQTATTTSATYALTWKDPAISIGSAWIEFFNRGSNSVRVAVGGAGVVATGSSQLVAAGARFRFNTLNPTADTHFAVLATTGTSEVNARTEIGLSNYLGSTFSQSGAATVEDVEVRNCLFRDLSDAAKGLRPTQSLIIMDCDFDRIYQDVFSMSPLPGVPTYYLRNLESIPFSRSGIAENLNGDARDPHGDQFQMFENSASGALGPVYYAGNRMRATPRRAGATAQGIFLSDNDVNPSYSGIYIVSTMQIGGSGRAISIGEAGTAFKVRDTFIYGATVFDVANPASTTPILTVDHEEDGNVYVGKAIAPTFTSTDAPMVLDQTLRLSDAVSIAAVFPNLSDLAAATTRSAIEAALTTAAEGEGLGATATANAVNWTTTDPTAVILWENLPSGVDWNDLTNQDAEEVITLPLRKILNRRASQTVSVGAGTEWRSVDTDGTTEVQAWTSSPGTIQPDQFIQIRRTSGAGGETVTASVTINGFAQNVDILSANIPTVYLIQPSPVGYFVDPSNAPAGTTRMTFRGKFNFSSIVNSMRPFMQASTGCDLIIATNGTITIVVEDSTGTAVLSNVVMAPAGSIAPSAWYDMILDVNHTAQTATLTLNGTVYSVPFTIAGTGTFQSNRQISMLASVSGGNALPAGTLIADLSVELNGVLRKAISNDAATANADAWKRGGDFTSVPS